MKNCLCGCPLKRSQGRYCNKECFYTYRTRPSGLKYVLRKENPTSFKKGQTPWNKGLTIQDKRVQQYAMKGAVAKKGKHSSPRTEFKKGQTLGDQNIQWKGDDVGYYALHGWVVRQLGKADICSNCGSNTNVNWANKSYEYKRDITDWEQLCAKCHKKNNYHSGYWGEATRRFLL